MPRHRSRKSYYRSYKRYSNETYSAQGTILSGQPVQVPVILTKSTDILGTRKAKNFTLSILTNSNIPMLFALVFVPEGTVPSTIEIGSSTEGSDPQYLLGASMYNPNQNVIMTGLVGGQSSTVERFKTRLARNLNSGDKIVLLLNPLDSSDESYNVVCTLNYAIAY